MTTNTEDKAIDEILDKATDVSERGMPITTAKAKLKALLLDAKIRQYKDFLLAFSGQMNPEPEDSMRFQLKALQKEREAL